ncbi:histone-lysine N-methyltransferase PRDM7-like [Lycorma delicatula]|uniref:histone-lysine N-methyltransferase PRDM7-like n=1 Tax=Lycorma delicatula TaxID=130591 RepID=UPI003F51249C
MFLFYFYSSFFTSCEVQEEDTALSSRRYPKRNIPMVNYSEPEDINQDDFIFCDECDRQWVGDCEIHGPLKHIKDTEVDTTKKDLLRSLKTIPKMLCVAQSSIYNAGAGVWSMKVIPKHSKFGPYEGKIVYTKREDTRYCWQIKKNDRDIFMVDGSNPAIGNWMRFVNCARFKEELNLLAYQHKGKIYYRTFKDIPPHQELLVWYGKEYGEKLGITKELFHKPDMTSIKSKFSARIGTSTSEPRGTGRKTDGKLDRRHCFYSSS